MHLHTLKSTSYLHHMSPHLLFGKESALLEMSWSEISQGERTEQKKRRVTSLRELGQMWWKSKSCEHCQKEQSTEVWDGCVRDVTLATSKSDNIKGKR